MTTVCELQPGDAVISVTFEAAPTFVAQTPHPIWPHLMLVIWRMPEGSGLPGDWSHDALDPLQDVGDVIPSTHAERQERLRKALLGGSR